MNAYCKITFFLLQADRELQKRYFMITVSKHLCTIRHVKAPEVEFMTWMSAQEGWNPGLYDGDCFYQTDPYGFWIAEYNNQPIGCISAVVYDDSFGFIGFYIVKPEFRHQGIGTELWTKGMSYLEMRTIGLNGILEHQSDYQKSGFQLAYRNIRYEGIGHSYPIHSSIVPLAKVPFAKLLKFDSTCFPVSREKFLRNWIRMPNVIGYGFMLKDRLIGYGIIRSCRNGYKIGPLFAESPLAAASLFKALSSCAIGSPVFIDIPEPNQHAFELVNDHHMKKVFETIRMYNKTAPVLPLYHIYGVTSLELG